MLRLCGTCVYPYQRMYRQGYDGRWWCALCDVTLDEDEHSQPIRPEECADDDRYDRFGE
jgi:hypothetical protein